MLASPIDLVSVDEVISIGSVEVGVEEVEGGLGSVVSANETSSKSPTSIISGGLLLDDSDNLVFNFFCKI